MTRHWREQYAEKVITPEQAIKRIHHGARVFIGSACGEPQALVRALVAGADLADAEIVHVLTLGVAAYTDPKYAAKFRANAFFIGDSMRGAVNEARAECALSGSVA